MKRYLLFKGPHYYPTGGWFDLSTQYDDLMEAINAGLAALDEEHRYEVDWAHIVDLQEGRVIWERRRKYGGSPGLYDPQEK